MWVSIAVYYFTRCSLKYARRHTYLCVVPSLLCAMLPKPISLTVRGGCYVTSGAFSIINVVVILFKRGDFVDKCCSLSMRIGFIITSQWLYYSQMLRHYT